MRTILLALFALMVSGVVWGQEALKGKVVSDETCTKVSIVIREVTLMDDVETLILKLKKSSQLSNEDKEDIKEKYVRLQRSYNNVYGFIKRDIASGFRFVDERRLCRLDYFRQLQTLETETSSFILQTKQKMEQKKHSWITSYSLNLNSTYKRDKEIEESNSVASSGIGEIISIGLSWLVKFFEDKAKEHADEFYDHVKWKDYDNI